MSGKGLGAALQKLGLPSQAHGLKWGCCRVHPGVERSHSLGLSLENRNWLCGREVGITNQKASGLRFLGVEFNYNKLSQALLQHLQQCTQH